MRRGASGIGALAVLALVAGCDGPGLPGSFSVEAADGLVTYSGTPSDSVIEPLVLGTLSWDDEGACWLVDGAYDVEGLVTPVFPEGTMSQPGTSITLPDGGVVEDGEEMVLGGAFGEVGTPRGLDDSMQCAGRPLWYSPDPGVHED